MDIESIITVTKLYTISLYCITFQCGNLLDPMLKKATQVLVFDVGGVTVATKFRYRCRSNTTLTSVAAPLLDTSSTLSVVASSGAAAQHGSADHRCNTSFPAFIMPGSGNTSRWPEITKTFQYKNFSFEANAEIYNEAHYVTAQRVRNLKLKLSPDDIQDKHRHYLERRVLSRAMRLYLLEQEMHSLGQNWTFATYTARDDNVYNKYMIEIDEHRIQNGYAHDCQEYCIANGCMYSTHNRVYSIDGNWSY